MLPPRPAAPKFPHEHEEVSLSDFDPRRYQHHDGGGRGRGREAYDDDESDDDMRFEIIILKTNGIYA